MIKTIETDQNTKLVADVPEDTELHTWETDGQRRDYSNVASWMSPDERYLLEITLDDPVKGWLVRLFKMDGDGGVYSHTRIGQTVVDTFADPMDVAVEMAAAADELEGVAEKPQIGPKYIEHEFFSERAPYTPAAPDEWSKSDEEWVNAMQSAIEKVDDEMKWGNPSLSKKTIDGNEYWYIQWRHDGKTETQYVAPAGGA